MSGENLSRDGGQSQDRPSSNSGPDDFNGLRPSSFTDVQSQSPFVRSLYEYPNEDVSNLLEDHNHFVHNMNGTDHGGAEGSSNMFQNLPPYSTSSQSLNDRLPAPMHTTPAETVDQSNYQMSEYERLLYNQYALKEDQCDEETSRHTANNNTHASNQSNHSSNHMNEIPNQFSSNLDSSADIRNINNFNHNDASLSPGPLGAGLPRPQVPQPTPMPGTPIEHSLPSSPTHPNSNSNQNDNENTHSLINRPSVFQGSLYYEKFPKSNDLVGPTKIPSLQLPPPPVYARFFSNITIPEWMVGELIEETLSHASASKTRSMSTTFLSSTTNSTTHNENEKHCIPCPICHLDLRVYKLVSLVSCPKCKGVFPNSKFNYGMKTISHAFQDIVARKYQR